MKKLLPGYVENKLSLIHLPLAPERKWPLEEQKPLLGHGYCSWAQEGPRSFSFSITKRKYCQNQPSDEAHHWSDILSDYWKPVLQLGSLGHDYNQIILETLDNENSTGKN